MLSTNGGSYAVVKNLTGRDGAHPVAGLVLSANILFGTTSDGGDLGLGTVFKIDLLSSPAPRLSVTLSNLSVVISWPSPSTGFLLQQNTNLTTTNWVTPTESAALYRAVGCELCDYQGFRGRQSILEILKVDGALDEMVARRATAREILGAARAQGFKTLADDGARLVRQGATSLEELMRVVDLTDRMA